MAGDLRKGRISIWLVCNRQEEIMVREVVRVHILGLGRPMSKLSKERSGK